MSDGRHRVSVVDYGGSNLLSVVRALRHCGAEVVLADDPPSIAAAERLVLPGVGAFGDVRKDLDARGLIEPLKEYAQSRRPFLGICVGMQLMLDRSEEFGSHEGLGLIRGVVREIPRIDPDGRQRRIPHIGWEDLEPAHGRSWSGTVMDGIAAGAAVYFVHSFAAVPEDESVRLADCMHDGARIAAVICRGALTGCQFHPEKSGAVGIRLLLNFLELPPAEQSAAA